MTAVFSTRLEVDGLVISIVAAKAETPLGLKGDPLSAVVEGLSLINKN